MDVELVKATNDVEQARGEDGSGYRIRQWGPGVSDQFLRILEFIVRQWLTLAHFGQHRFVGSDFLADRSRNPILQPPDVNEGAPGENHCHHRG